MNIKIGLYGFDKLLANTPEGKFYVQTEDQVVGLEMERVNKKLPVLFDLDEKNFYSQCEKSNSAVKVSNRAMRIPLKLRPGGRFGHYNPNNGDLGLGDAPTYDKAVITMAHLRYAIQWTHLVESATDSSEKAIKSAYQDMIAQAMPEFRRAVNTLCMTGGNGVLGTVTSVSSSGGTDTLTLNTDGFGVKLLRYGQPINIYSSDLVTQRTSSGELQISFYDLPNKVIKVPTISGTTAGDKILVSGLSGSSPASILGVQYHNNNGSTGTWLGFDRSTTPEIRANRVNAGGGLALPFPRLAVNKIGDRVGRSQVNKSIKAYMHPCQKDAYERLGTLVSIIQKNAKDDNLNMYFGDGMQMAGAPVEDLWEWDKTRIDFIPISTFGRAEMEAAQFYTVGGRKIFEVRGSSGGVQTSNLQYIVTSFNLFCENPAALSYIDALSIPSGY